MKTVFASSLLAVAAMVTILAVATVFAASHENPARPVAASKH